MFVYPLHVHFQKDSNKYYYKIQSNKKIAMEQTKRYNMLIIGQCSPYYWKWFNIKIQNDKKNTLKHLKTQSGIIKCKINV